MFGGNVENPYLCIAFQGKRMKFGLWCNGSTTGFGSVCPGSNPGSPTKNEALQRCCGVLFFFVTLSVTVSLFSLSLLPEN